MEQHLEQKTGKSLDTWLKIVQDHGESKHTKIVAFLKEEYGITHGYANFISLKARKSDAVSLELSGEDLLTRQYEGKEDLKPIYDALHKAMTAFGDDVQVIPKKAAVSFKVKRQFGLVQPSTKTRVDLGLRFNNRETGERLGNSGPFGAMCTHRVQLTDASQVDDEVIGWLREAYEEAR